MHISTELRKKNPLLFPIVHQQKMHKRYAYRVSMLLFLIFGLTSLQKAWATTYTSVTSGSWNADATWSGTGVPGSGDIVTIENGHVIYLQSDALCSSLTIKNTGNGTSTLKLFNPNNNSPFTLSLGSITFTPGYEDEVELQFGTGTLKVSGAINFPTNYGNYLSFTFTAGTPGGGIEFNGSITQTLDVSDFRGNLPNLYFNNSVGVTLIDEHITTNGNIVIERGYLHNGTRRITGNSGTFEIKSGATFITTRTSTYPSTANQVPTGFTFSLNSGSTFEYAGTENGGDQTIAILPYSNLKISGSGTKTPSGPITLGQTMYISNGNTLSLSNGSITLGNYDLTVQPGGSISNYSSSNYIKQTGTGGLKRQVQNNNTNVDFPVGTSAHYLPVKIKLASSGGTVTDMYSVRAIDFVYDNYTNNAPTGNKFIDNAFNNTWIIDESVAGGSNVTLTFSWHNTNTNGLTNFDLQKTRITHFYNGGWDDDTPAAATLSNGYYSVSRLNINSFSPFGIFSGTPTPLPVELISFTATKKDNAAYLQWLTASEKNNKGFYIQTSADGRNFEDIGFVASHNPNSSSTQQYDFLDKTANSGLRYYRLKQTDFDGTVSYSSIKAVNFEGRNQAPVIYPNPFNEQINVNIEADKNEELRYQLIDLTGKTVFENTQKLIKGSNVIQINLDKEYPAGVYLLKTQSSNTATCTRILRQ